MGLLAWSQLRHRPFRMLTLLLGLVLATSAFTTLTAAAKTSQLRTTGTVSSHFVPVYDILVRPRGARTGLETSTGTVQPNFLSGIYGGISIRAYHQIRSIPGVWVAAPVAMVGYALLSSAILKPLPASSYDEPGRQVYRLTNTWVSGQGTDRVTQPPSYLYVTPRPLRFDRDSNHPSIREVLPDGRSTPACATFTSGYPHDPFGVAGQSGADCWSKVNGDPPFTKAKADTTMYVGWALPVLIAAVDPVEEAKLDGLNRAVVSGSYLGENSTSKDIGDHTATFPVLASSSIGMDEYADTTVQRLTAPTTTPRIDEPWMARHADAPGTTVTRFRTTAAQAYHHLLASMRGPNGLRNDLAAYWSVGPVTYRRDPSGQLTPLEVHNRLSIWRTPSEELVPMDESGPQYRSITVHSHASNKYSLDDGAIATPQLVGSFDPAKVASFDPLSGVPLGIYQPTEAAPANSRTARDLHGHDLLPSENLGGYVSQPANLITSLSALPALQNTEHYSGNLHRSDPISVIRVRVSGVTGPNQLSLARIREVAQQIETRTHLDVDIVDGASGLPTTIDLAPPNNSTAPLLLTEEWVKKGVGLTILSAVDRNSLALYLLILVVCAVFVGNSASVAVRARRSELGLLACLGWTRPRLFATVLAELAGIGLVAGVLGAALARGLAPAVGLHTSTGRAALAVPVSIGVAVLAGLPPAWLAAHADPAGSVRPAVLAARRAHHPRGITAMAVVNLLRTPGRALLAALSLAAGIVAFTVLAAVSFAFHGVLVGSLLGGAVALQVRGVDYVAATATITVGVVAVADIVVLNIRERAAELSAIRSFGWRESALGRLVVTEGALIGLIGSLVGAGVGLYVAGRFAGTIPERLYAIVAVEVLAGVLITALAALVPAQALRRLPTAQLLAEE